LKSSHLLLPSPPGSPKVPDVIQDLSTAEYRCPGETYAIPRAVHLGRLADFYLACRHCPRRDDTVGLSARQIRRLAEVASRAQQRPLFQVEGVGQVAIDDLSPSLAQRIAVEFARRMMWRSLPTCQNHGDAGSLPTCPTRDLNRKPAAVVAGDGRLATAAIIAAIVEGLRWTGCETVDIGPASSPCTARAIQHLAADGGIFVGNAHGSAHTVGLKFWAHGAPLSQGGLLDDVAASLVNRSGAALIDRPTRTLGPLRRFAAADVYLNDLRPAYHALRPLRFVLHCTVGPFVAYLDELIRSVACRVISAESAQLGDQVVAAQAHFGLAIDDDGENCHVVDERGQTVEAERLSALIAGSFAGVVMQGEKLRQQTFLRMQECGAAMAVDRAGRLWYASGHDPLPDALQTLTRLLVLLSRDDRAFSAWCGAAVASSGG
jgi:phosphomannomutase